MANETMNPRGWRFLGRFFDWSQRPLLMGIVNVTPDSFSDGGQFLAADAAVEQALRLVAEGADILDIGGESTRPGAEPVPLDEELRRVIPVIERTASRIGVPISVDTTKAEVARRAILAGAEIVNDISGLQFDAAMVDVCRETKAGVICMHIQGTPQTMQQNPHYEDAVREICGYFRERLESLEASGVPAERVMLDPGVGFGKTAEHNLEILSNIAAFHELGRPVLIGHSRKRFLKKLLGRDVDERLAGGLGVSLALAAQGVEMLRVHDVAAHRDALVAWRTIQAMSVRASAPDPASRFQLPRNKDEE
jgi:dihydropteroate synthase